MLAASVLAIAALAYWAFSTYDPKMIARRCQGNIAALADAQEEYCKRHFKYASTPTELSKEKGGVLSGEPKCPLDGDRYRIKADPQTGEVTVFCINGEEHAACLGTAEDYIARLIGGDRRK